MPFGRSDHTMNSGSTSAEWKRDRGGRATMARLPSSQGLPRPWRLPPREEAPPRMPGVTSAPEGVRPRPRGATAGVAACLLGRPRPLLGGGEPGPSLGAFPFSAAENLRIGAMDDAAQQRSKEEEEEAGGAEEEMGDGGSAPFPFIAKRRPTAGLHDLR